MSLPTRLRGQRGQTSAEWIGILLIAAVLIAGVFSSPIGTRIADGIQVAICRISGGACEDGSGATADGRPPLSECVRTSSSRGISGAVKIAVVKFGAGVEGIKEVRADKTVRVQIKANAKAGLEFGPPGGEIEGGGVNAGERNEVSLTGKGEYGRAWTFENEAEADAFIQDVTDKAKAIANPLPNLPFTHDDADIDLPPQDETTYAGGVEVRGKGKLGGAGLEGNLGVGGGAIFNEDRESPGYGDKTYFFEVSGGLEASPPGGAAPSAAAKKAGLFSVGGSGQGRTRIAITYDKDGREKSLRVLGQFDATATAELKQAIEGKDLTGFLEGAEKAKRGAKGEAGGRVQFTADLDLRDPENLAAARAFIDGRDASGRPVGRLDSAGALFDRFRDDARLNARFYALTKSKTGGELDLGVFAVSGELTSEDARLVDAYYRDLAQGGFKRWEDCVIGGS